MAVYARSAEDLSVPATVPVARMRATDAVRAGTLTYDGPDLVTGWHTHDQHQIEYALEGVAEVETASGHYLLPPQQAVWVPAGLAHNTTLRGVRSVSVFFDPAMVPAAGDRARILAAAPVIREMIVYGSRWPVERVESDAVADAFFEALALLTIDWLEHEQPLRLPTSADPVVSATMQYTDEHLAGISVASAARAVGVSERTLRRRFTAATGITWRRYLLHSRLLRSMALLAEPAPRTVLDVATTVGFDSVSAFTRAFHAYTGEAPSAYRRRTTAPSP